jgi:hypothetical protein
MRILPAGKLVSTGKTLALNGWHEPNFGHNSPLPDGKPTAAFS